MSKTIVYVYVMTNDSGFAPCIDNGLFTLACCKGGLNGGMRKSAGKEVKAENNVYVLGICGKKLAKTNDMEYSPVYLAKIDDAICMTEYYKDGGLSRNRQDDAYEITTDGLKHKGADYPHYNCNHDQEKDKGGKYVLFSSHFVYLGDKCGEFGQEIKAVFDEMITAIKKSPRGYMVCRDFNELEKIDKIRELCVSTSCIGDTISSRSTVEIIEDDDDDVEKVFTSGCGGCKGK